MTVSVSSSVQSACFVYAVDSGNALINLVMNGEKKCGMLLMTVLMLCQWLQQLMEKYALPSFFLEMYELNHLLFISCGYCIIYVLVGWIHFINRNMVYTSVHNLRGHQ